LFERPLFIDGHVSFSQQSLGLIWREAKKTAMGLKHGLMPQPHRPLMVDCSLLARLTR
jgi:hypothetical protein